MGLDRKEWHNLIMFPSVCVPFNINVGACNDVCFGFSLSARGVQDLFAPFSILPLFTSLPPPFSSPFHLSLLSSLSHFLSPFFSPFFFVSSISSPNAQCWSHITWGEIFLVIPCLCLLFPSYCILLCCPVFGLKFVYLVWLDHITRCFVMEGFLWRCSFSSEW